MPGRFSFPYEASSATLTAVFYEETDWLGGLAALVLPMLDDFSAVVVQDASELGSQWRDQPAGKADRSGGKQVTNFALILDGFIVLGGPVGDGERTLHVVEASDEAEIRLRLAADPWARDGLLEVGSIEPWSLWLDSPQRGNTS